MRACLPRDACAALFPAASSSRAPPLLCAPDMRDCSPPLLPHVSCRGLSWWSGLVMAVTMLIWASAATIPAFALAAHSHHRSARGDPSLHGVTQHSANSKGGALQRGNTAKAMPGGAAGAAAKGSEAEVAALRAEVADLQARMASLQAQLAEAGAGVAGSGHA